MPIGVVLTIKLASLPKISFLQPLNAGTETSPEEIFSCRDLGGLLIGGVSLKAQEFSEICIMAG